MGKLTHEFCCAGDSSVWKKNPPKLMDDIGISQDCTDSSNFWIPQKSWQKVKVAKWQMLQERMLSKWQSCPLRFFVSTKKQKKENTTTKKNETHLALNAISSATNCGRSEQTWQKRRSLTPLTTGPGAAARSPATWRMPSLSSWRWLVMWMLRSEAGWFTQDFYPNSFRYIYIYI